MPASLPASDRRGRPSIASLGVDLALGALAALGQAPLNLWYVTVLALAVLCWRVAHSGSARRSAWHGLAAGFGHFALALSWIIEPFLVEPEVYGWMAPFALFFMALGGAVFWTLPALLAGRITPEPAARGLAFAALIVLSDWIRGWIFTGLPWALTGHVWIATPAGQTAATFGAIGLSALTMLAASLPVAFARHNRECWRRPLPGAILSVLLIGTAWSAGMARLAQPLPPDTGHHLRLIQPNATQALKWDPYWSEVFLRRLVDLSAARDPGRPAPELVIWPETAVNFLLEQAGSAPQDIAAYAGAPVALGIQRVEGERYFNSLTEFSSRGIGPIYDKFHLVPFGEYTPWGDSLARFGIRAFAAQHGFGYSPGPGPALLTLGGLPPVQPLICYEAVFSRHLLTGAERPAWLLQVTNDAWFGTVSGPWQHLAQARLRAIESGLPLMRAANTGVSAVIDARGGIRATLGLDLVGRIDAALPAALPPTPWSRWGDWPAVLAALAAVLAAAFHRRLTATRGRSIRHP
ncbi:MAG TPA: apolipoprotein N-acyltransferase [Paracoccus sp. (in: a-proteobacteria)]|uniref:apolipoprotein N-acyltransferase n=1 Tax=Paracoccus sp. TaxID=267 RepID=UPI002CB45955|nr:apolipoprotein N-acyltransferase [Paracoccus sp. (in: a-proteobacteria)]HWL58204.1 apolipoprotein N-acyltransferase [Paracoccus sp. (in: a-proteobacteria)]